MPISYTDLIEKLQLEPLNPEGGYYRRSYETAQTVNLGKGYHQPAGTAIYFLLTPDTFSALHWLDEDEVYHFYLGDPVELYEFDGEGRMKRTVLGQSLENDHQLQYAVRGKRWHGSRLVLGGQWALLGTTMAPGFIWEEFKLGTREELIRQYPGHQGVIESLTRTENGH